MYAADLRHKCMVLAQYAHYMRIVFDNDRIATESVWALATEAETPR